MKSTRRSLGRLCGFCCLLAVCLSGCDTQVSPAAPTQPAQRLPFGTIPESTSPESTSPESTSASFVDMLRNNVEGVSLTYLPDHTDPELLIFRIPAQSLTPDIIGYPQVGISPRSAYASADLKLLLGSGFVSQTHSLEPVGLLQVNGNTLSPVQVHGYTRILGINESGFGVVHRSAFNRDLFYSALQAGPGIVERGQLDITERDLKRPRYFRAFIGLCNDAWLAGISLTPVHLRTLGEQMIAWFAADNLNCSEVVNLAGDRQAVLMATLADGRIAYHGDINTHKVSLIGFTD